MAPPRKGTKAYKLYLKRQCDRRRRQRRAVRDKALEKKLAAARRQEASRWQSVVDEAVRDKNSEKREKGHLEVMRPIVWWLIETILVRRECCYVFVCLSIFSRQHGIVDASA